MKVAEHGPGLIDHPLDPIFGSSSFFSVAADGVPDVVH